MKTKWLCAYCKKEYETECPWFSRYPNQECGQLNQKAGSGCFILAEDAKRLNEADKLLNKVNQHKECNMIVKGDFIDIIEKLAELADECRDAGNGKAAKLLDEAENMVDQARRLI